MRTGTIELPGWMGSFYSPIPRWRFPATLGDLWKYDIEGARARLAAAGFRVVARAEHRQSFVCVSAPYYWPARLWMWWRRHRWILEELALRIHLYRGPYDGHFYHEARFGPPDLWGEPLRKWENWFV